MIIAESRPRSTSQTAANGSAPAGPAISITPSEDLVRARVEAARETLWREAGLRDEHGRHFRRPVELPFLKSQRASTTLLFGGLTWKHEELIRASWEGMGYRCEVIPTPDVKAFQLGKEYGNNGQCNPTYFTVGNLVQYLARLREEKGLSVDEINSQYVFLTAGACGPCRFGMYEAEYRLALKNSGFDDFRVLLFQQSGGLNQSEAEQGLDMNLDFFLGMINAMLVGDLVNELAYQIRPYEIENGDTDRALAESMAYLAEVFRKHQPWTLEGSPLGRFVRQAVPGGSKTGEFLGKFVHQLRSDEYTKALEWVRDRFDRVPVDRLRVKPLVKITGEFWAQTTEGDGNFNMFPFLEREGAQVLVEPIATWIMYMIHQAKQKVHDRRGLAEGELEPATWDVRRRFAREKAYRSKLAKLAFAEAVFKREFERLRAALGGVCHELACQVELQRLGHPFYNSRSGGGEGHLEVAKNIYYMNKDLAHMVLSLKPFGCMPSTQSDGAQAAVVSKFKDMIFLPIETSGEGEINAHSRVQMALGEAKFKAKEEFARVLAATGYSLAEMQAYVRAHPELARPSYPVSHVKGVIGVAAGFARHLGERMAAAGVPQRSAAATAAAVQPAPAELAEVAS
jgi:predicted nucleotide-binding protein (sugar kinase/HSP70/actin superfamily)